MIVLSGLATAFLLGYERCREPKYLESAINVQQEVVSASTAADGEVRASRLSNLAVMLHKRYDITGDLDDLNNALAAAEAATTDTTHDHPNLSTFLSTLADLRHARYEHTGEVEDLDAAVTMAGRAVDLTSAVQLGPPGPLTSLGSALACRYNRHQDPEDRERAIEAYVTTMDDRSVPPSIRIRAGRAAANQLARTDPQRAGKLLETAVQLLPTVTPRQLDRQDHPHVFAGFTNLAADAAALVLGNAEVPDEECATRALGLLEIGRNVLLGQVLDDRGAELATLRKHYPDLAERFSELRSLLDQAADPLRLGQDRHRIAAELDSTLAAIRTQTGFDRFALPPTLPALLAETYDGTVVVFNISIHRCDAFLLTASGVVTLPLPGLTVKELIDKFRSFYEAMVASSESRTQSGILEWLWDNVTRPVLSALGHRRTCLAESAPRIWWVPGGILGLLPLHASGYHSDPADDVERRTVLDRVVSSTIASIRTLHHVRQRASAPQSAGRALIVAMPIESDTPAPNDLPAARVEAASLRDMLPDSIVLSGGLCGPDAPTRSNVLRHLPTCALAHFSCHGIVNHLDPSQSLLQLHDALTVASLDEITLERARLVFLCSTGSQPGLVQYRAHMESDDSNHS